MVTEFQLDCRNEWKVRGNLIEIPPFLDPKVLQVFTNSENCHFVNHLCAYLRYNNIPEFFSKLGNLEGEAIAVYSLAWSTT